MIEKSPEFLLIGPGRDPHLEAVERALHSLGRKARLLDSRTPLALSLRPRSVAASRIAGIAFADCAGALLRALPPRQPALVEALRRPLDANRWRAGQMEADAARDALSALLAWLHAEGRPVLNPPAGGTYLENKPLQLEAAARAGLPIPDTWVTSEPGEARDAVAALAARGATAIAKPVRGGAYASRLDGADDPRLARLARAPVIVQEEVRGADVRAFFLDGELLGAARIEGTSSLDFREDPAYREGRASYVPVEVPRATVGAMGAVLDELGLVFAGVDFKGRDGELVFLEANGAPVYLEQERALGLDISARIARFLVEGRTR